MNSYLIMIVRIALFDLETTGFPKKAGHTTIKYTNLESFDSARIVQIGMMIYEFDMSDDSYKLVKTYDKTIKPDNFVIRNAYIHNITQEHAESQGVPFCDVIYEMMEDLCNIDILIAHNLKFDKPVLLSELHRYEFGEIVKKINSAYTFCTMAQGTLITKIKNKNNTYKYPYLFDENTTNEHNALADTRVLAKCFWQLYDLDLISIDDEGVILLTD